MKSTNTESSSLNVPKFLPWFLKISLPLYLIDQITKWWTVFRFSEPALGYNATSDSPIPVIDGVFWINRVHNQGMAWGIGNGSNWAPFVFPVILTAALIGILFFWKKNGFPTRVTRIAAALIISGIIGNFTDRLLQGFFLEAWKGASFFTRFTKGYVVDMIDVTIPVINYRWPCFNIADSCIFIAAGLLIWASFFSKEYKEAAT